MQSSTAKSSLAMFELLMKAHATGAGCLVLASCFHAQDKTYEVTTRLREPNNPSSEEIVRISKSGSSTFLTNNSRIDRCPTVSPSGDTIAFLRIFSKTFPEVQGIVASELWLINSDGTGEKRIAKDFFACSSVTWNPINQEIAFIGIANDKRESLICYDLGTNTSRVLTHKARAWPAFSPDGMRIAFYNDSNELCIIDVRNVGKTAVKVCSEIGNTWGLYWTADSRLLFSQEDRGWMEFDPKESSFLRLGDKIPEDRIIIDQSRAEWAMRISGQ